VGKTKRGKGTKLMALADSSGLPFAMNAASASPHEVTLVKQTLESRFTEEKPERLVGDRAYDSDLLDTAMAVSSGTKMSSYSISSGYSLGGVVRIRRSTARTPSPLG
jgi:hypothetical protein